MALTQKQIQASKDYMSGKISSDEYKRLYVPNYNPTKDPTAGKNIEYRPNPVVEQRLQEQVQQPLQQPEQQPLQRDFTSQISQQYDLATQNMVNQLKQRIAQARSEQEGIISRAPQQFDPLRSQSELAKGQQLRSVLERNALMGDRGGVGRSQALQTQTTGENRLNQINLQQQNVIDTANQRIADLEAQGRFEEASITQQQKLAELQSLMREQQRQDEIARQDLLRSQDLARQDQLMGQEQSREDFATSIMANYNDLSAYSDRLRAQGAPQWQIDQVEAARLQKVMEQNLDPRTGQPLPVDSTPSLTSSSAALQLWEQLGVANEAVSRALGIPVGTRFTQSAARATGATGTSQAPVSELPPKQVIALAESSLRGTSGNTSADRLVQLNEAGYFDNLTPSEIKTLMNKFGVTELMLEQAENRATIPSQGITLPSGRNTNQNGITPTTGGFTGALNMIR